MMATRLSGLIPTATQSHKSFLYRAPTFTQFCHSSYARRFPHRDSLNHADQENSGHPTTNEIKYASTKDCPPVEDPTPMQKPRKSYLRHRSSFDEPQPGTRETYTRQEQSIFADLIAQLAPHKDKLEKNKPARKQAAPSSTKSDITEILDYFKFLNGEEVFSERRTKSSGDRTDSRATRSKDSSPTVNKLLKIRLSDLEPLTEANGKFDRYFSTSEAIRYVVDREAKKIDAELFQALNSGKGDRQIWELCNERIFSLKSSESTEAPKIPPISTPTSTSISSIDEGVSNVPQTNIEAKASPFLNIPAVLPANHVLSKLYPMACLTAFRILGAHFPESPLIGQFRSSMRAQGRFSAVFGASRALYDEQIGYFWHICEDLPAVTALLHDMELIGQEPSGRIRSLLKEIVQQHDEAAAEGWSAFWDLPTNKKAYEDLVKPGGLLERINSTKKRGNMQAVSLL